MTGDDDLVNVSQRRVSFKTFINISLLFRPTAEAIEAAGFTKVDQKKYDLPFRDDISLIFTVVRTFVRRHVMGVAVK